MKLCIGTVQFGMDYGINNQNKPTLNQALEMLDYATQNEIDTIDTAYAYGNAESIVGEFLRLKTVPRNRLNIVSKLKPNILDGCNEKNYIKIIKENIVESLKKLQTDYVDAYLLHSARYVYNDEILYSLNQLKKEGYTKMIGASIYEVDEAKRGILSSYIDIIQLPFSIFDQRMRNEKVFDMHEIVSTKIHSRSAFLQGLILMDEERIPSFLHQAKPIVHSINNLCLKHNISKIALAISYVRKHECIDKLVFGVDNLHQLKENIKLFYNYVDDSIIEDIAKEFENIEANIIMPSLWSKK